MVTPQQQAKIPAMWQALQNAVNRMNSFDIPFTPAMKTSRRTAESVYRDFATTISSADWNQIRSAYHLGIASAEEVIREIQKIQMRTLKPMPTVTPTPTTPAPGAPKDPLGPFPRPGGPTPWITSEFNWKPWLIGGAVLIALMMATRVK